MRRALFVLLLLAPMLTVSVARFVIPGNVLRSSLSQNALKMLAFIEDGYQPGDVVYHVGDGSWIEMHNYTSLPFYKMPTCGPVRGALSPLTRYGLGVDVVPLEQVEWARAWVITAESPMTPPCEPLQIRRYINGLHPVYCMVNNIIESSCLYLVEHDKLQ